MGNIYRFDCKACGYTAKVSGGPDRGMDSFSTTISCQSCQEVMDIRVAPPTVARNTLNVLVLIVLGLLWVGVFLLWIWLCNSMGNFLGIRQQADWIVWIEFATGMGVAAAAWFGAHRVATALIPPPRDQVLHCKNSEGHPCQLWKGECPKCGARMKRGPCVMNWD